VLLNIVNRIIWSPGQVVRLCSWRFSCAGRREFRPKP